MVIMMVAKRGYKVNIEKETKKNTYFRRVLYTARYSQLVLMSLKPGEEIGAEVHNDRDQFFRFESGKGAVIINGKRKLVQDGNAVIVPAGARHNVVNTAKRGMLKLYTIYSPPEHMDKVVRRTRKEAITKEEEFDGRTTE